MQSELLARLNAARQKRQAVIRVTGIGSSEDRLVLEGEVAADDPLRDELLARFASAKSGIVETAPGARVFLTVHVPPPRLVAIGAVHITQALAPMARIAGFDVTIIDPRTAFASSARFEGADLHAVWPQDMIPSRIAFDAYTALVAVTHDPKIDDFPLIEALRSGALYVGALGSRKTHAKRVERLKAAGLDDALIGRIRAPIGLNIGAQSPAEIAVSILAEIIMALRGPKERGGAAAPGMGPAA